MISGFVFCWYTLPDKWPMAANGIWILLQLSKACRNVSQKWHK